MHCNLDRERFYEDLQQTNKNKSNQTFHLLICGDINTRVGNLPIPEIEQLLGDFNPSTNKN